MRKLVVMPVVSAAQARPLYQSRVPFSPAANTSLAPEPHTPCRVAVEPVVNASLAQALVSERRSVRCSRVPLVPTTKMLSAPLPQMSVRIAVLVGVGITLQAYLEVEASAGPVSATALSLVGPSPAPPSLTAPSPLAPSTLRPSTGAPSGKAPSAPPSGVGLQTHASHPDLSLLQVAVPLAPPVQVHALVSPTEQTPPPPSSSLQPRARRPAAARTATAKLIRESIVCSF